MIRFLLTMHAFAAKRGDGLRPELLQALQRISHEADTPIRDGHDPTGINPTVTQPASIFRDDREIAGKIQLVKFDRRQVAAVNQRKKLPSKS